VVVLVVEATVLGKCIAFDELKRLNCTSGAALVDAGCAVVHSFGGARRLNVGEPLLCTCGVAAAKVLDNVGDTVGDTDASRREKV
jgi:hypothetical protein